MEQIDCGHRLVSLQKERGITSVELARRMGVTPQQVVRWRQTANLKVHTLQRLCEALGVGVMAFLEG